MSQKTPTPKTPAGPPPSQKRPPSRGGATANPPKGKDGKDAKKGKDDIDGGAVEQPVPTVYDRLEEVWKLETPEKQREMVSQLFNLPDGPGVCYEAMVLDEQMNQLAFARDSGFNVEQTRVFHEIMTKIFERLRDETITLEANFKAFKEHVLANSIFAPKPQPSESSEPASDAATAASAAPAPSARGPSSSSSSKPDSKDSKKQSSETAAAAAAAAAKGGTSTSTKPADSKSQEKKKKEEDATMTTAAAAAATAEDGGEGNGSSSGDSSAGGKVFNGDHVKLITDFVAKGGGVFGNYLLFQCAFNKRVFVPRKHVVVIRNKLDSLVPQSLQLSDATDVGHEDLEAKAKAESASATVTPATADGATTASSSASSFAAGSATTTTTSSAASAAAASPALPLSPAQPRKEEATDEIAALVARHMSQAKDDMLRILQENEKQMENKLKAIEARLPK